MVPSPRLVRHLLESETGSKVKAVAAGSGHSLVATRSSGLYGMGTNKWWQLGLPQSDNFDVPTPVCLSSLPIYIYIARTFTRVYSRALQNAINCQHFLCKFLFGHTRALPKTRTLQREQHHPRVQSYKCLEAFTLIRMARQHRYEAHPQPVLQYCGSRDYVCKPRFVFRDSTYCVPDTPIKTNPPTLSLRPFVDTSATSAVTTEKVAKGETPREDNSV